MTGREHGSATAKSILAALLGRFGLGGVVAPGPGSGHSRPRGPGRGRGERPVDVPVASTAPYPGDFFGPLHPTYDPHDDQLADPGEVVWAWVPYEDDPSQGKDRPALIVARDGDWLLALPVTSHDHDRDAAQEAAAGRYWVDIGRGAWDSRSRASEARVNRVLRLAPSSVRRVGARLDEAVFATVCAAMAAHR
ncbi:MAG: type II toxin-antitoxin system PemK/MazF family toxin [Austwickia sp.]|jgi:hypothetical protein|nr:MAG: type II toxin-antitoxin system PemK/MazF family toxin [Austwickia sp.]